MTTENNPPKIKKAPEIYPDITIEYVNGNLVVIHPVDSKLPKFTRIKTTTNDDQMTKTSTYRISGV